MNRAQQLMPEGIPKWIRCYDNEGRSLDQYTILFTRKRLSGQFMYIAANAKPFHPQGFGQHDFSDEPIDYPTYGHLGKKIKFTDLPPDVQELVVSDYKEIWEI